MASSAARADATCAVQRGRTLQEHTDLRLANALHVGEGERRTAAARQLQRWSERKTAASCSAPQPASSGTRTSAPPALRACCTRRCSPAHAHTACWLQRADARWHQWHAQLPARRLRLHVLLHGSGAAARVARMSMWLQQQLMCACCQRTCCADERNRARLATVGRDAQRCSGIEKQGVEGAAWHAIPVDAQQQSEARAAADKQTGGRTAIGAACFCLHVECSSVSLFRRAIEQVSEPWL